jgi:hypothetical protein
VQAHPSSRRLLRARSSINGTPSIKELAMQINGLTERQVELLDTMWAIEEFTELEQWMATLSRADRFEAENLQRLVILETFEEMLEQDGYPDANRVIDQFRLTK